jgi:hypothetical protein
VCPDRPRTGRAARRTRATAARGGAVVVGVPVRVEAEPRGRPDLDERERWRERRERGEQGRAAGGDVRLGRAAQHHRRDVVAPHPHGVGELRARRERSPQVLDRAEQQLGLPRVLGQGGQEGEEVGVAADVVGERRVQRRPARRLDVGEAPVAGGELLDCRRCGHGPIVRAAPPHPQRPRRVSRPCNGRGADDDCTRGTGPGDAPSHPGPVPRVHSARCVVELSHDRVVRRTSG